MRIRLLGGSAEGEGGGREGRGEQRGRNGRKEEGEGGGAKGLRIADSIKSMGVAQYQGNYTDPEWLWAAGGGGTRAAHAPKATECARACPRVKRGGGGLPCT